jgi:hypothetical protein
MNEMYPHLPGNAPGRTGETQEKGGKDPVRERLLALGEERLGQIVERPPAAFAPVAFQSLPIMVCAPGPDFVAVTPGTLEWAIFPPQGMNVEVAGLGMEELVKRRQYRHR